MKTKNLFLFFILLTILTSCKNEKIDDTNSNNNSTVYYGGDILTMEGDKPTYVEALVVNSGKILFVGNSDEAMKIAGPGHKMIDLEGKTLIPGLIDGHAHFANFGAQAIGAQLLPPPDATAKNIPTIIQLLSEWNTPENRELTGWIFGTGFDDSILEEKRFPTKKDLDKVSTEFPVLISHISGHFCVVNSKGLEVLGITSETKDPEGGIIRREPGSSEPNGVLEELAAIPRMIKAITPSNDEAVEKFFEAGQELALSFGYTTAQEGRAMDNNQLLINMAENDKYKLDVVSYVDYQFVDKFMNTKWNSKDYYNHFRIGGMKLTLDGSPQGRTAWRTEPYLLPPDGMPADYSGYPAIPDDDDVINIYEKAFKNNWQTLTHANGDAAMDQMIRTLKPLQAKYGQNDRRFVLIHGQYIRPDQLDEFKDLDVITSLFPLHTFYWGDWHTQIIGEELGRNISPVQTALNKGVKITIHTDAPVALPNLMRVLWTATNRVSRSGKILNQEERLTPYQALKAITEWSAYQHFEEDKKGTLSKGKLADLVILDKNPLKIDLNDIQNIVILETIKEGITVYKK